MRNAEEHKKLLAQIAELEKISVNYFDVEKEFFLITSDNLDKVQSKFYGYSIQRDGIYEEDNLTPEAIKNLDGRGCYVYVEVRDGKITIKQDINGCWGIYIFRSGDYFALSNSFFRLLDYVKFKYPLTVNRDYCNYHMIEGLSTKSYFQTAINEVQLLDRNSILQIEIASKSFEIEIMTHKEHTIFIDSEEGIHALDSWVEFWGNLLRRVSQNTKFFSADLSGGFDSRIAFVPLLYSGIDLNTIRINSANDNLYSHKEDYAVASKIAKHYDFKLNRPTPSSHSLNYSLVDIFNMDFYTLQPVHTQIYVKLQKSVEKRYNLNGFCGETVRGYWNVPTKEFIANQKLRGRGYPRHLSDELKRSVEDILASGFNIIRNKYEIEDPNSRDIPQYLYKEAWSRSHHGKEVVSFQFANFISLSPVLDPKLRMLRLYTPECRDHNLLVAFIFARYEPDLLTFPFSSSHLIAPETIEYAKKINEQFPRRPKDVVEVTRGGGAFHLFLVD